jgi:DNA mismatch repair protein MSH6
MCCESATKLNMCFRSQSLEAPPLKNSKEALWLKFKPPVSDTNVANSKPYVPRLKRVQDEAPEGNSSDKTSDLSSDPNKRRKLMDALGVEEGPTQGSKWAAAQAKFDWLLPSKIKDAKGRRPDHPLYDKRTLYIPPDVLTKMTASQRQYWTAKSKYMDTVLFFKVVSRSSLFGFKVMTS